MLMDVMTAPSSFIPESPLVNFSHSDPHPTRISRVAVGIRVDKRVGVGVGPANFVMASRTGSGDENEDRRSVVHFAMGER
jgi:hypothetical protein